MPGSQLCHRICWSYYRTVLRAGAYAVVVGTSITRPEIITSRYTAEIKRYFESK